MVGGRVCTILLYEEELTWRGEVQVERGVFHCPLVEYAPGTTDAIWFAHYLSLMQPACSTGHQVPYDFPEPPKAHTWRVVRRSNRISLAVDGQGRVGRQRRSKSISIGLPRFGESRSDELHAGSLTLDWMRYRRWLPLELRLGDDAVLTKLDSILGGRLGLDHLLE